jgi:sulfoxide reductase heme-binding subunit YedZ
MNDVRFYKFLIAINAILPAALMIFDGIRGEIGVNPAEFVVRTTGVMTLVFMLVSLAVTPVRAIFGWNILIRFRRMLGLFAFYYAASHLVAYSVFDKSGDVGAIATDVGERPFIAVGFAAFVLLIPLAVTSTNGWVKRLGGKNWAKLHKLAYVIAALGVVHFWMIVKSDVIFPALFASLLIVLMLFRVFNSAPKAKVPVRD